MGMISPSWSCRRTSIRLRTMKMFHLPLTALLSVFVFLATTNHALSAIPDEPSECNDSWTTTSVSNAPTGRYGHTAVWTGTEMIVWGGEDENFVYLNSGGKYNPGSDRWTATSTTNAPTARSGHTAVWTGSEMIVWGGFDSSFSRVNSGARYNPITDTWTAISTSNAP